jgi:hypothetical protein
MVRSVLVLACCMGWPCPSLADDSSLTDSTWDYASRGRLAIDAGLAIGFPAALPTGLGMGVGAGITHAAAGVTWGARAAWLTTSESSLTWTVSHDDLQLRLTGGLAQRAGRGAFGLRLGLGGTLVHESRVRNQGMRAGLPATELESSTFTLLPAADFDAVITLHVAGPWLMLLTGGPSGNLLDGRLHAAWNANLGVAWQP